MNSVPSFKPLFSVSWRTQFVRWMLLLVVTLLLTVLLPSPFGNEYADLREGAVSSRDVDAPFDFEILKDADKLAQERFDARRTVPPVVEFNDSLTRKLKQQFSVTSNRLETELHDLSASATLSPDTAVRTIVESIFTESRFYLPRETAEWLIEKYLSDSRSIVDALQRWRQLQSAILAQGIFHDRSETADSVVMAKDGNTTKRRSIDSYILESELQETILSKLREQEPSEEMIRAAYALLRPMLVANWNYNAEETDRLRDAAAVNVPSAQGIVLKGERIIDRGKRIDEKQISVLRSLLVKRDELYAYRGFWGQFLPRLGIALSIFAIFFIWSSLLLLMRPHRMRRISDLLLALMLLAAPIFILARGILPAEWSTLYFPAGAFIMSIAILFDVEIALIAVGMLAGLAGIVGEGRLSLVLYAVFSGVTPLAIVGRVTTRGHLFRATPVVLVASTILVVSRAASEMMWSLETTQDVIAGAVMSAATPLLVFGIVYLAEKMFRVTTDLTYLELSDFNRPILRRLAFEAPGTFHHSILVGALSEAAARAVGGNPVLARCAAYYHDIGKLDARDFFIENQSEKSNPHEELTPVESAEILRNHVLRGIEMARELHLPSEVVAAIPEHHGTMVMTFFHNRALHQQNAVDENDYRYRGPRPRSKETAILMLADGCEAVSRTLKDAGKEELRKAIRSIIRERMGDGQLDHAPLTFLELRRIESAFVTVLDGIMHKRITYPQPAQYSPKAVT